MITVKGVNQMKVDEINLAKWFKNRIKTIMEHNKMAEDLVCVAECEKADKWTPCDLIAREYLNNGGGSAKGFLGLLPSECIKCYRYMAENKDYLIANDLISKEAWNNFGFPLWHDYNFDR